MGVDTRKPPPLPAPTDISSVANDHDDSVLADDLATDLSRRTDKTSYSIPEDGSPITISTKRPKEAGIGGKISAHHSQTSLLIEYFEAGKSGDKVRSRPSVRVRVTPSAHKRSKTVSDQLDITQTSADTKKPAYTRRISLGNKTAEAQTQGAGTELSYSSESNISALPVEVEVFQNGSDLSQSSVVRGPLLPTTSTEISSMPPDSMLEGTPRIVTPGHRSEQSLGREDIYVEKATLKAPAHDHNRSASQERIVKNVLGRVMGETADSVPIKGKISSSKGRSSSREELAESMRSPRRKAAKKIDDYSPTESSLLSSNVQRRSGDTASVRSGVSAASSINNPKLLQTVEDAIKRLILPELNAMKEEQRMQKTQKNRDRFESSTAHRDSVASYSSREELKRSLSKSKSTPNVGKTKPKVLLDRDGDNPGITVSGDSTKGRDSRSSRRRSSRESSDSYRDEDRSHRKKSSKERHRSRDAALAGAAIGGLTAAALKHHDSKSSMDKSERRKRRSSKSRSRTASLSESIDDDYRKKEDIPPMPMSSFIHGSEVTRDSILSSGTEAQESGLQTPIREVSRGSVREVASPGPQTPTKTPVSLRRGIETQHSNKSLGDISIHSARSDRSLSKLKAAYIEPESRPISHIADVEQYSTTGRELSPIQSVASFQDRQARAGHQEYTGSPHSGRSRVSSLSREFERKHSNLSMDSLVSTPSSKHGHTKQRPHGVNMESPEDILDQHEKAYDYGTPRSEADDFFEKNHKVNDMYRQEYEESNLGSPTDERRFTGFTENSTDSPLVDRTAAGQEVRGISGNPEYVHTPVAVESAVASLHEPSNLSSVHSSLPNSAKEQHHSPLIPSPLIPQTQTAEKPIQTTTNETTKQVPLVGHDPAHRLSPAKERWSLLKEQAARSLNSSRSQHESASNSNSQKSNERSVKDDTTVMGASALPLAHDPMPETGYGIDDASDVTTNPSIIQGPIGGEAYASQGRWPLDVTPAVAAARSHEEENDVNHFSGSTDKTAAFAGAGATAAGIAAAAANRIAKEQESQSLHEDHDYQPSLEDEYNATKAYQRESFSPQISAQWKDEGYNSANQPDAVTPEPHRDTAGLFDDDGYTPDLLEDPFTVGKHGRHVSLGSHGMESPLYDAANGRGIDRIQSRDVVALMDHLTVRDAQRNARDTEILVSLVRSAAEMRNQFEDMKKYIAQQDAMIMQNSNQKAASLEQRILQGPRPQPLGSPRVPRRASTDDGTEDTQTKKKNVFRRALKGLGMKSSNDLAHIETMLMQLLDEVEGLKAVQHAQAPMTSSQSQSQIMNSYENLRASGDPGYEPEGQAGTSSTPNQSDYVSNPSSSKPHVGAMHSGYDGRRGSEHRISTVLEGDEDLDEHEQRALDNQFENNERLLTPTQEVRRGIPQSDTPPSKEPSSGKSVENTPKRKHKSSASSIWGIPKISRWSKTTASTNPDGARDSFDQQGRPYSDHSQASSRGDVRYEDDEYEDAPDDRPRSKASAQGSQVARSIGGASQARSPSPLIPEEDYDGPKYQAHRNSLNLQHPQPRAGPNGRAMHLEGQAVSFANVPTPLSHMEHYNDDDYEKHDQWGSNPSLVLGRNRPTSATAPYQHGRGLSPIDSDGGYSDHSASEQAQRLGTSKAADAPLVPPKVALDSSDANTGASNYNRPGGYSSPYSSGHLAPLEPIQEVRYSLETDRGREAMTPSPRLGKSQGMQTPQRKITGPRQMPGSRNASGTGQTAAQANVGQVRRKAVAKEADNESIPSYRSSFESETF